MKSGSCLPPLRRRTTDLCALRVLPQRSRKWSPDDRGDAPGYFVGMVDTAAQPPKRRHRDRHDDRRQLRIASSRQHLLAESSSKFVRHREPAAVLGLQDPPGDAAAVLAEPGRSVDGAVLPPTAPTSSDRGLARTDGLAATSAPHSDRIGADGSLRERHIERRQFPTDQFTLHRPRDGETSRQERSSPHGWTRLPSGVAISAPLPRSPLAKKKRRPVGGRGVERVWTGACVSSSSCGEARCSGCRRCGSSRPQPACRRGTWS